MTEYIEPISKGASSIGLFQEKNDCAVRALANASKIPYLDAHKLLSKHGRESKGGCNTYTYHSAYTEAGLTLIGVYGTTNATNYFRRYLICAHLKGCTLKNVMEDLKWGSYVVIIRGHALAVVNGNIIDSSYNKANSRVVAVYKV